MKYANILLPCIPRMSGPRSGIRRPCPRTPDTAPGHSRQILKQKEKKRIAVS